MNTRWAGILTILALIGLSGCATMSGDECLTSDWHAIGFEDGSRGYTMERLSNHRKACAKHGVTPDFEAYQTGRDEGLGDYCQPSRGFNLGTSGSRYNGVCPSHSERYFLDAYNAGYQLYSLRANVSNANDAINAKRYEQERIEERVTQKEVELIASATSAERRVVLLADLKDLSERSGQLDAEIYQLIEDRAHHEHDLASYEAMIADSGY